MPPNVSLDWHKFVVSLLPVLVAFVINWLSLSWANNLQRKARDELVNEKGLTEGMADVAIQMAQGLGLLTRTFSGLLPVIAALAILVVSRSPVDAVAVVILVLVIIAWAVVLAFMQSVTIERLYAGLNPQERNRYKWLESISTKARQKNIGAFVTRALIVSAALITAYMAYLSAVQ